jgi:Arc/MetJ family transcription regulator
LIGAVHLPAFRDRPAIRPAIVFAPFSSSDWESLYSSWPLPFNVVGNRWLPCQLIDVKCQWLPTSFFNHVRVTGFMAKDSPSQMMPKVQIRMDEDFRQRLMEAAYKADRSLNAEIMARLEKSFELDAHIKRADERGDALEERVNAMSETMKKIQATLARQGQERAKRRLAKQESQNG